MHILGEWTLAPRPLARCRQAWSKHKKHATVIFPLSTRLRKSYQLRGEAASSLSCVREDFACSRRSAAFTDLFQSLVDNILEDTQGCRQRDCTYVR